MSLRVRVVVAALVTYACAALSAAGVPSSFVRIPGAGHGFEGVDFTRATSEMVRWFEWHLRGVTK